MDVATPWRAGGGEGLTAVNSVNPVESIGGIRSTHDEVRDAARAPVHVTDPATADDDAGVQQATAHDAIGRVAHSRSDSVTDPLTDSQGADDLVDLGDRIAILAASIHSATYRLLVMVAEFDRGEGWVADGFACCADWLAVRAGIRRGSAREHVRAARALGSLPETSAAMGRGELSFAKVRALTRVATTETEGDLLAFAQSASAAGLERMVRSWKCRSRGDEAELERCRHRSRTLSVFPDEDDGGMYVIRGRLDPEVGALLMRAIEAASDALYRTEMRGRAGPQGVGSDRSVGNEAVGGDDGPDFTALADLEGMPSCLRPEAFGQGVTTAEQRRADALGLLAEQALTGGFGTGANEDKDSKEEQSPETRSAPISGTRAQRYQVLLHVEASTLDAEAEPGRSHLEDGTRVAAETSRRLACDASMVRVTHGQDGAILDVGRKTRTIPPSIRRALEARDRGCRFPGCGVRFTDAHHIRHWADGGDTRLQNLILLCRRHHRLLHEEGFRVQLNDWPGGRPAFYNPRGIPVPEGPPRVKIVRNSLGRIERIAQRGRDRRADVPNPGKPSNRVVLPKEARDESTEAPDESTEARDESIDPESAIEIIMRDNQGIGAHPDFDTACQRYKSEQDVPLNLYLRAVEAVLNGSGPSDPIRFDPSPSRPRVPHSPSG